MTVLNEYFISLRDEIHIRIQQHHYLVWIKVISVGAIIWFLITNYAAIKPNSTNQMHPSILYFIWIIPLAAVIFDILIASNIRVINNLGHYIKKYLERKAFDEIIEPINKKHEKILFKVKSEASLVKSLDKKEVPKGWEEEFNKLLIPFYKRWLLFFKIVRVIVNEPNKEWEIDNNGSRYHVIKKDEWLYIKHFWFGLWEEKAAQANPKYHCYKCVDATVIWLLTFTSWFFSLFLRISIGGFNPWWNLDLVFAVICAVLIIWAWISLIRSVKLERRF